MQIVILGMHRAGTSVTTRIINMMGAYFGPADIALPASIDNPKGFWERQDILQANRALLRHFHATWHRVDQYDAGGEVPQPILQHMRAIIGELNTHLPWVMKDPRFCLTLPCWLPLLTQPMAVIVSRDPLAIAQSLYDRNTMPPEYGLALWEYYTVHCIRNAHALPKAFVNYEALIKDPLQNVRALYDTLAANGAALRMPEEKELLEFIDPALQRSHSSNQPVLTTHQQKLLSMLRGEITFDKTVEVSPASKQIMERLGAQVSGAPSGQSG